jgi:hypothetical protein
MSEFPIGARILLFTKFCNCQRLRGVVENVGTDPDRVLIRTAPYAAEWVLRRDIWSWRILEEEPNAKTEP